MRLEFKCDQNVLGYHDIEVDKLPLWAWKSPAYTWLELAVFYRYFLNLQQFYCSLQIQLEISFDLTLKILKA